MANWSADASLSVGVQGIPYTLPFSLGPSTTASQNFLANSSQAITATPTISSSVLFDAVSTPTPVATITASVAVNPVTYESTGAGSSANGNISWTHTIGASANCLIVAATTRTYLYSIPTCTVGSTYMKVLGLQSYDPASNRFVVIWGLLNPPTGTQTISVTGQTNYTGANSIAYSGVSGFSIPEYSIGVGTSTSLTVDTDVDGGITVQALASNATPAGKVFTNYNQTSRWNQRTASMYGLLIGDTGGQNANDSVFTASQDTAWEWGSIGVTLLPSSSAPTGVYLDALGNGYGQNTASTFSLKHVATQSSYVFCDIAVDRNCTLTNVQYGGQPMTLLGSARYTGYSGNAGIYRYGYGPVATSGMASVTGSFGVAVQTQINTVSYFGMGHAAALQTVSANAGSPSQAVTCSAGQVILESIGIYAAAMTGVSGGKNLFLYGNTNNSLVMNQASSSSTFTTTNTGVNWGGIATVLSGPNSVSLAITVTPTAEPKTGTPYTGESALAITSTLTSDSLRNAIVNAPQAITATPDQVFLRNANVDSAVPITVTLLRDFLRNVNVDSVTQAITAGRVGQDVVTFDSVGVGATGSGTPKTITWNHTISPSANYVIMAVSILVNGAYSYSSLTALLGSTPMTYLGGIESYDTSPGPYSIYFWGVANPPTGTQTFSVGTSSLATYLAANTVAYQNVGAVSPIYPMAGASGTLLTQGPIYGDPSQLIVQAFANGKNVLLSSYSQTIRYNVSGSANVNAPLLIGDAKPSLLPSLTTIGGGTLATTARTTMTWAQIAQAGDTVLVWVETNTGEYVTTGTYAGVTMTNLGSATSGNVTLTLLVASNVPAGSSTVSVTKNSSTHSIQGNSVAYSGVASVTGFVTNTGTSNSPSISVSPAAGQMAVAGLVSLTTADYTGTSGGTLRWTGSGATVQAVFESTSAATFSATSTTSVVWAAIGAILTPSAVNTQANFAATSSAADFFGGLAIGLVAAPSGTRNANVDSSQALTITESQVALRNAIVNSATQAITASPSGLLNAGFKIGSAPQITATPSGIGSYGAVANTPTTAITSTNTGTGSYGAVADSLLPVTHSTVEFDYARAGTAYGTYGGCVWTHYATAGATVFVHAGSTDGIYNVQYGGVVMTAGYGGWYITNVPGGGSAVWINTPPATRVTGISVSYTGMVTYGAVTSGSPQTITLNPGEMAVQFSNGSTTLSGGTVRVAYSDTQYFAYGAADSSTSTTFSSGGTQYVVVLSPQPKPQLAASGNASSVITVGETGIVKWGLKANSQLALTADISALENESAVLATPLDVTSTTTADATKTRMVEGGTEVITATLTADMLHNVNVDSDLYILTTLASTATRNAIVDVDSATTATITAGTKWYSHADVDMPLTVTDSSTGTRLAKVAASLPVTASPTTDSLIDHPAHTSLAVTSTASTVANADFVLAATMLVSASSVIAALRHIEADVDLTITGTTPSNVKWSLKAQAVQEITATDSVTGTRNARVNASLVVSGDPYNYMIQTESFDVLLRVMAELTAILNVDTTMETPTTEIVTDISGYRVWRLLYADSDSLEVTVEIPPSDGLVSHYAEAVVIVDNSFENSANIDALFAAPIEIDADTPVVINQDALIDAPLEIQAIFINEAVMDALLDALATAGVIGITAEGIRGQYVDADQEVNVVATEEIKWNVMIQALLDLPVSTWVDGRSGQASSNFFVFYL